MVLSFHRINTHCPRVEGIYTGTVPTQYGKKKTKSTDEALLSGYIPSAVGESLQQTFSNSALIDIKPVPIESKRKWVATFGTAQGSADTTIYTVPQDKYLYLVNCWITAADQTAPYTEEGRLTFIYTDVPYQDILMLTWTDSPNMGIKVMDFAIPRRIDPGTRIRISIASTDIRADGGINGWLEPIV